MNKISINLKHCYGIKKLIAEFDFSNGRTFAIYAPNGVMKTSFANTFKDLSEGKSPKDYVFPDRETKCKILDERNKEIMREEMFVIEPYKKDYKSGNISTLLVNKELKENYDAIHLRIDQVKQDLINELQKVSGIKDGVEDEISEAFLHEKGKFFDVLARIEQEVLDNSEPEYADIYYKEIFNDKVLNFLSAKDSKEKIAEYIEKYNELVESSTFFKKGIFNHTNASSVAKSLEDNGFFKANHSVSMCKKDRNDAVVIKTKKELESLINQEKETIINNSDLVKTFEELDKKIKNVELKQFREYLMNNMKILPQLANLDSFKQKLWVSYMKVNKEILARLISIYNSSKIRLIEIIEQAKKEETDWLAVIATFNKRFFVPFKLQICNQEDVILKRDVPNIAFIFKDIADEAQVEVDALTSVLSSGEKRALYLLNIIFEIEARKRNNQTTIFIVDDIADSFDYKNKYAIIEYLKDISEFERFYQIILTHNFDFYRTINSRFIPRNHCLMVYKTDKEINLVVAECMQPFENFKKHLHDDEVVMIAFIPFVRNLIEYTKGKNNSDYISLTSLLHLKADTSAITVKDLLDVIYRTVPDIQRKDVKGNDKKVVELILILADHIANESSEKISLENKIVLSIAIRLKAEETMIASINDSAKTNGIIKNQTIELFKMYKAKNVYSDKRVQLIEQVILMTPENIHLNSFMYEPILDMSDEHLKKLYKDIRAMAQPARIPSDRRQPESHRSIGTNPPPL